MDQSLKVVQFYTGCLEFFLSRHAGRNCHRQRARRPKSCAFRDEPGAICGMQAQDKHDKFRILRSGIRVFGRAP